MRNFRRDDRSSGGGFSSQGGSASGRSRGGSGFGGPKKFGGGRDGGRPTMYHAICSECGDDCEIPFRPSGGRPVFCSVCFDKQGGGSSSRPSFGGDRRERRERPSFDRGDREMFDVVCDKCGENCQVPFRPTAGKPVYCSNCFDKGDKGSKSSGGGSYEDFKTINAKLDMIMTALGLSPEKTSKKEPSIAKAKNDKKQIKKMEVEKVEKPKAKKTTSKKEVKPKKEVKEKKVKEVVKKALAKKKVVAKKKK